MFTANSTLSLLYWCHQRCCWEFSIIPHC